jgi:UDP-glucose 4-epimerase
MPRKGAYCLVLGTFARQKLRGEPLTIVNTGDQRRDFTYVGDVVDANIKAAEFSGILRGEVFNIGNGNNYSVNEVADMIGGEKIFGEKRLEPFETLADNTKAHLILGWKPTDRLKAWLEDYKRKLGI